MSRIHQTPGLDGLTVGLEPAKRRWQTPRWFIALLEQELGRFVLDACADASNAVAPAWIDRAEDCLLTEWGPGTGDGWIWVNCPYGVKAGACPPYCQKDHVHHAYPFPGTGAFVDRAIQQAASHRLRVAMLLESATDTGWWRKAHAAACETRLLPRVACCNEQGEPMGAPGGGSTLFLLNGRRPVGAPAVPAWCWDVRP